MATYADPAFERLAGSSASTGAPPTFESIANITGSSMFDPLLYIADMRAVGVTLAIDPRSDGFTIDGRDHGIPGEVVEVNLMWAALAASDPDWISKVGGALRAERDDERRLIPEADPVFEAIEEHRRLRAITESKHSDEEIEASLPAQDVALDALLDDAPTTIAGLKAFIAHIDDYLASGDTTVCARALPLIAEASRELLHAPPLRSSGTGYDATLIALGKELDRLLPLLEAADQERRRLEAQRDASLPPVPPDLICDPKRRFSEDVEHFTGYVTPGSSEDDRRYYMAGAIKRLRDLPRVKYVVEPHPEFEGELIRRRVPDPDQQARVPAVIAAFEDWQAAIWQLGDAVGYTAAAARHEEIQARYHAVLEAIYRLVPLTLQGLAVQAKATESNLYNGEPLGALVVERLVEFAEATMPAATTGEVDPVVARFEEANRLRDIINSDDTSAEEAEPLYTRFSAVERSMFGVRPRSAAGARASLEWAIFELRTAESDGERADGLIWSLLDGALDYLKGQGIRDLNPALDCRSPQRAVRPAQVAA